MRLAGSLCLISMAFTVISVCSAQTNQTPMNNDKMLMHNAMIRGDTKTMGKMLGSGVVKIDDWVGIGNLQTWVEDACWCASPVAMDYLLQHGADTLRSDVTNSSFPKLHSVNALTWCIAAGTRPPGPDTAEVFRTFIKYFEQQLNQTPDPRKTLNEQIAMAGGTGRLVELAVGNKSEDACMEKVKWIVKSGQDITECKR